MRSIGSPYILGAMATTWRLQQLLASGKSMPRLRRMLSAPALAAHGPRLASIVLGVAIAGQIAGIALSLSGALAAGSAVGVRASVRAHVNKERTVLAGITSAHLFGAAPQSMTVAEASAASQGPLVLTGTLATNNPRDGFAIVGAAGATHVIYVGSEAVPGTVLIKVFPKWVVLQRGAERLTLRFHRGGRAGGAGAGPLYTALLDQRSAPNPEDGSDTDPFAMHDPPPPRHLTDDAAVMQSFGGLSPAKTIDGQDGMQIEGTAFNKAALAAMGLHGGDVIVQINGVAVDAPNAPDLIRALQSGSVSLTVDRKGEDTSVSIDPSTLADAASAFRQADSDL